ncbi:MAG: hypothetical protein WC455_17600 [Dehalococcoidia bacterium]|jgi:uncharacterized protein YbjQ (UPF0145 family)
MENKTTVNVDCDSLFSSLLSGTLVSAFYSALILEKMNGVEITQDVRDRVAMEVQQLHAAFHSARLTAIANLALHGSKEP